MKKKILFVCRGNVGRSQMAAAIFNRLTRDKYEVSSAGTKVVSNEGESCDGQILKDMKSGVEHVIDALREKGIDVSNSRRTQLVPKMVDDADIVVVMAEPENIPDYLKDLPKMIYFKVDDPKDTSPEKHREVRDRIKAILIDFIKEKGL
jgi:arsenate reductase (thioredoxin)